MPSGRTDAGADAQVADPQAVRANKLELIEHIADDLAHEIKNPLHSMVINLEVLKRRIARANGTPPEELLRYVGVLSGELERVNRRVELLLRLVRPNRAGDDPTTLDAILEELLELLDLERKRRKISIHREATEVPVRGHLPVDPARQLVLGLLTDALELVPAGGSVRVRTEVDDSWARLLLEFDAADPADGVTAREELLGRLALARGLAEGLGGHLEVAGGPAGPPHQDEILSLVLSVPLAASTSRGSFPPLSGTETEPG